MVAVARLRDDEIDAGLAGLDGWTREGDAIERTVELASFPEAIAFVGRVAVLAEEANHHPDLDIRYRKVRVLLTTHDEGGLTARDLRLAGAIDGVVAGGTGG
jgi:4a-hydroxytetrahydrobiopterin dehydratase